jgi:hypothetical protein
MLPFSGVGETFYNVIPLGSERGHSYDGALQHDDTCIQSKLRKRLLEFYIFRVTVSRWSNFFLFLPEGLTSTWMA